MPITKYKNLTLSSFQQIAIKNIIKNKNIIVSTHTGNGKTLIADYAIEKCYKEGFDVIYTAPIKALSNQKYKEFIEYFGINNVGLITGDTTINQNAKILIMTTEILRNILNEDPDRLSNTKYIIFDEIHYISDEERGTIWEEAIILKPKQTKIIGLSATIPNLQELVNWINDIHNEEVEAVYYPERIINQQHFYFDKKLKRCSFENIINNYNYQKQINNYMPYNNTHLDLAKYIINENLLPMLYFVFSRKQCESKALELSKKAILTTKEEQIKIENIIYEYETLYKDLNKSKSWREIKNIVKYGIGFHHAGLLPIIKEFMEKIFNEKLCKVLYVTETFSVGLNFPVKTVCFDSLRKYDGKTFRNLLGSEYLQMSGRAGRRGIDNIGYVFILADYDILEKYYFPNINHLVVEPIKSKFCLSYNTTLNLLKRYDKQILKEFFKKNFANYQYMYDLNKKKKILENKKQNIINKQCILEKDKCPLNKIKLKNKIKSLEKKYRTKNIDNNELKNKTKIYEEKLNNDFYKCNNIKLCKTNIKKHFKDIKKIQYELENISKKTKNNPENFFLNKFKNKINILKELNFIDENNNLLPKGITCSNLHTQEVLLTELIYSNFFKDNDIITIISVLSGIVFEDCNYNNTLFNYNLNLNFVYSIITRIQFLEEKYEKKIETYYLENICSVIYQWTSGIDFNNIIELSNISEGDFVNIIRQIIELIKQIKNVINDKEIINKLNLGINLINRDLVRIGL